MFEFGDLRFRPIEREDLKLLHVWENDYELMMFSRSRPMNSRSMVQLEQQFEEWMKDERETRFIIELADSKEAVGIARVEIWDGCNMRNANVGTYIGKKVWGVRDWVDRLRLRCWRFVSTCLTWNVARVFQKKRPDWETVSGPFNSYAPRHAKSSNPSRFSSIYWRRN